MTPLVETIRALRIAGLVMLLQGLIVVVFGLIELASSHREWGFGVSSAGFFVAYGIAMGLCGWGLHGSRRWARGPSLLMELLNLGLAWNLHGNAWRAVLGLAIPSALVLVCLLLPGSVASLEDDGGRDLTK